MVVIPWSSGYGGCWGLLGTPGTVLAGLPDDTIALSSINHRGRHETVPAPSSRCNRHRRGHSSTLRIRDFAVSSED